jgi:hypothetical protein
LISLAGLGDRARREINQMENIMTRNEHDEIESVALVAMAGLLSHGSVPQEDIAAKAFDIAESFQQEKAKRIGDKPPYDH